MAAKSILLLLIVAAVGEASRSAITLEKSGYKGIVIGIGRDVPEDDNLIEKIKVTHRL